MKKIYLVLVRAYSRESYDDSNFIVDAFVDKELAKKVANGLDDATDTRINTWIIKQAERDGILEALHNNQQEYSDVEYDAKVQAINDEYEKYEVYFDSYYYTVREIDLIN